METQPSTLTTRRQRGRAKGPPTEKFTVLLPLELGEWAKQRPEGLSALLRRLLEAERQRERGSAA